MCDCLVAVGAAADKGRTLFAKNSDRPPQEVQRIEWLAPRRQQGLVRATHVEVEASSGDTIGVLVSRPWWMWGVEHGVNQFGVAIGNETIYTTVDPRSFPPALVGMDLVRLGLERAASASQAVDVMTGLLERYGQGGSGHHGADRPYWSSFLIADPADAWVLETSAKTWAAERVDGTRAISNRTTIAGFDAAHRHPRQPVATLVDPRLRASQAVLDRRPLTVAGLRAHARSHVGGEGGWTVCMHVPNVEATTAAVIAELPGPGGGRPLAHLLLGSPCASVFVPLYVGRPVGQPVKGERFARLAADRAPGDERSALLDDLERDLAASATDDDGWAAEAWARVDKTLTSVGV